MKLKNGRTLHWGTYAMFLYCENNNCNLSGLLEQLGSLQFDLKILVQMLKAANEAADGEEWAIKEMLKWVDESGGVFAKDGELIDFVNYVVKNTVVNQSNPIDSEEDGEKKSLA
jgi:hypothetical protein